ncbi:3-hydroxyacyl-CoA dehydrogenase NAD-binding domain-containing protein [Planctomicrobium sp. SH664]|uniref:3-hydroxyacyl-CoA dehydrogenase NAD-binding domain-containing protein n=1 Tax=Planctomicrobium sp. SH664 TaxID=3448125 RepID=UPI003F5B83FB
MNAETNFTVTTDPRGVMTAVLDVPQRPVNVFEDSVLRELADIVARVEAAGKAGGVEPPVRMLVIRSAKPTGFLAGADIHRLQHIDSKGEAEWVLEQGQQLFSRIEQLAVPTLAIIHGACMGGGLELALACRYRLAVNDNATKLGLPEVKLGLLPGWGGTQRLPKRIGLMQALPMILEGKTVSAAKAKKIGLVDGLISSITAESEIDEFINRHLDGSEVLAPPVGWKEWLVNETGLGRKFALKQARSQTAKAARQYPALSKIIDCIEAGLSSTKVSDLGLQAERQGFTELLFGPVSQNLIGLFLMQEKAKKGSTWTTGVEGSPVNSVAVIGAGTMGAGIAQLAASRGCRVIMQDVKQEFVDRGMATVRSLFANAVKKQALSQQEMDEAIARMVPRVDWGESAGVDLMIEAVVEKPEIKQAVFRAADGVLPAGAVLASNTSALPVDIMAEATHRPDKVAGLHFFNPVHKMPLVEVVRAPGTSDQTIATLVGAVKKFGKVPVVVKQSPGFLVNRILFPYLDEAARLVTEGYSPRDIDREAKKFGMPMGPLELLDVVGIDVALDVSRTLSPLAQQSTPAPDLFQRMCDANEKGQKTGRGFYQWNNGKRGEPTELAGVTITSPPTPLPDWNVGGETFGTLQQRLVLSMLNEAKKCLAEKVVEEPWMVDLGMVLGTGFAPFRGGPMKCISTWGVETVNLRLKLLAARLGPRFEPAELPEEHALLAEKHGIS